MSLQANQTDPIVQLWQGGESHRLAADIMTCKDLSCIPSDRHGIDHEDIAVHGYESTVTSTKVMRMRLLVDKDHIPCSEHLSMDVVM